MAHTLRFHEYEEAHHAVVGGKCGSLGAMIVAGLPVPPGFAVTTHAFDASIGRSSNVQSMVEARLHGLDVTDLAALSDAAAECRHLVLDQGPAPEVEAAIRSGYAALCEQTGVADLPVAVRSSATAEDQPDASFAGPTGHVPVDPRARTKS